MQSWQRSRPATPKMMMMDSVNGAGASRQGSEMEGSRWQCHCFAFDYLVVRADDRVELPVSQGLCMKPGVGAA